MMQETKTVVIRSKILRITVKLDNSRAIIYFIDRVQTKTVRYLTFGIQAEKITGYIRKQNWNGCLEGTSIYHQAQ